MDKDSHETGLRFRDPFWAFPSQPSCGLPQLIHSECGISIGVNKDTSRIYLATNVEYHGYTRLHYFMYCISSYLDVVEALCGCLVGPSDTGLVVVMHFGGFTHGGTLE
eukprot:12822294-Ditylum_brightwellii.AAC.1